MKTIYQREKGKKRYPMDGPPMRIQRLMQSPQRNHKELFSWLKENPGTRPETAELCKKKSR
jgi:hypothetical protein